MKSYQIYGKQFLYKSSIIQKNQGLEILLSFKYMSILQEQSYDEHHPLKEHKTTYRTLYLSLKIQITCKNIVRYTLMVL